MKIKAAVVEKKGDPFVIKDDTEWPNRCSSTYGGQRYLPLRRSYS